MKGLFAVCILAWTSTFPAWAQEAQGTSQETLKATVVEPKEAKSEAAASATGAFETATCTQGEHKRVVSLTSTDPGKSVPCEVHYKKETEQPGHDQIIYTAVSDVTFCEAKAKEFVAKLSGWGWACN